MLTILPQDVKTWWQVKADDKPSGLVGAFVSTTAPNFTIPSGTNLLAGLDSNALTYVLSQNVTDTTSPIPITFTAYDPTTTKAVTVVKHRR